MIRETIVAGIKRGWKRVVIDASKLEYISGFGAGAFAEIVNAATSMRGGMILCGLQSTPVEVLRLTGFSQLLTIAARRAEAIQQISNDNILEELFGESWLRQEQRARTEEQTSETSTDEARGSGDQPPSFAPTLDQEFDPVLTQERTLSPHELQSLKAALDAVGDLIAHDLSNVEPLPIPPMRLMRLIALSYLLGMRKTPYGEPWPVDESGMHLSREQVTHILAVLTDMEGLLARIPASVRSVFANSSGGRSWTKALEVFGLE